MRIKKAFIHFVPLIVWLLAACPLAAQQPNEGICFEANKSFAEVLQKAGAESKLVFVDCYTSWCGPCKQMAAKEFPKKEMGDYFNPKFVSVKIDMEKGEGPELLKRYDVSAFPTFLFLDANGELVHRMVGYKPAESFVQEVEKGITNSELVNSKKRYANGDRSAAFIVAYLSLLNQNIMRGEVKRITAAYLADKTPAMLANDSTAFQVFCDYMDSPMDSIFQRMYGGEKLLVEKYGATADDKFWQVWSEYPQLFYQADGKTITSYDMNRLNEYIGFMKQYKVRYVEAIRLNYTLISAKIQKNWKEAARLAKLYLKQPKMSDSDAIDFCTDLTENMPRDKELVSLIQNRLKVLDQEEKSNPAAKSAYPLYIYKGTKLYSKAAYYEVRYNELLKEWAKS